MSKHPSTISGFTVLPITYSLSATHIIYAREHSASKKTNPKLLPEGRTLFLVNVPPDATERELVFLFKYAGTVERVVFDQSAVEDGHDSDDEGDQDDDIEVDKNPEGVPPHKKRKTEKGEAPKIVPLPIKPVRTLRRSGGTAHVVFLDSSSLSRALSSPKPRPWPSSEEPSGLEHYIALHDSLRPPLDAVREHADTYMVAHEYELAKTKQNSKYRKGEAIVDEDGFTLVTRGGAYGRTLGGGVAVATKKFEDTGEPSSSRKKKKPKEKDTFYAFQKADKQKKALADLKKKWEEDKANIEKLKVSRRFKPY